MSGLEGLLAGRVLAHRYRIEEVIGRGGMGVVYRATDERLARKVAVKVITVAGGIDAEARERLRVRFHREARSAAALPHHPNVVPVYDYGTDEDLGLDFLIMELLHGEDLAARLSRAGAPPLTTALWILREAARGVAVGHRVGMVHRDVKPGNIFLVDSGHGEVQVRILDFGIAKLAAEEDTLGALTQDGRAPLSPAYASPEQLRGLMNLTPASDVFSLGAIGYQLLTGERAYTDSDRNHFSLGQPVAPPSLRQRNPAVPQQVEAIIQRGLAYEPGERPADADEFGRQLDQARREMGDEPLPPYRPGGFGVPARPEADDDRTMLAPPTPPPAADDDRTLLDPHADRAAMRPTPPLPPRRRPEKKRGAGGIVVATLIMLLLAGAGFAIWHFTQPGPPQRAEIPPPPAEMPEIDIDIPVQDTVTPGAAELEALIANREGMRYYNQGDLPMALHQFRLARDIAPDNPTYRHNYGVTLLRLGAAEEAARELEQVVRISPTHVEAFGNLAQARLQLGDTVGAIDAYERVLTADPSPRQRAATERRLRDIRATRAEPRDTIVIPTPDAPRDTVVIPAGPP
jgi:serine/threonine protein kinase